MNREILFRGLYIGKEHRNLVTGYYSKEYNRTFIWINIFEDTQVEIIASLIDNVGSLIRIEVIPSSVEQFSGFTDHSGNKIFEGDILSSHIENMTFEVVFHGGCFKVKATYLDIPENMWGTLENYLAIEKNAGHVHVIGNTIIRN